MGVKLLCTGDVHLGRRPSRLPEHLDAVATSAAAVWEAIVDQAIERAVDAVVLTGDVVDQDNRFFEAYSALARGVRRLVQAHITVYAVAGNHDFDVFVRLAEELPDFNLLGRGGVWQETELKRDGKAVLRLVGWSFPSSHVSTSPLAGACLPQRRMPTIGLLHCDCDVAPSRYAPVSRTELAAAPVDAWLLGHIHEPQIISESGPMILYPGSPQGLHVNETGPHGPWLVEIEPGREPTAIHLPLAALRWEHLDVPLDDVSDPDAFDQTIARALKGLHEQIRDGFGLARAVGCRLRLTGRTGIYHALDGLIAQMQENLTESLSFDGVEYFLDTKVLNAARPDISLADRAATGDPAGLLARRLAVLDNRQPPEEYRQLVRRAKRSIVSSEAMRGFASATGDTAEISDDEAAEMLMATGWAILDSLLAQEGRGR